MEVAPRLLKIPKSECPDVWIRLPRQQIMEKHWRYRGTSSTKLERSSISRSALGKTVRRSFDRTWTGESSELGMYVRSSETMVISVGICGWHQNGWTEAEYGSHVEEIDEKRGSWWTHISSWSCVLGVHPAWVQTEWNSHWTVFEDVWVTCFWWSNRKITAVGKNLTHKQWGGPTTWKDMLKNAMNDTAKWQTRKWSRSTKFQVLAWMIINSSTKNWNQWENCQKLAHTFLKCLYLARTGRPDISCGQSTSLRDQSRHGLRHVTDAWQGWFLTFITQTISDSIVMWETRHSIADWVCFKTQTLHEILRTQNLLLVEYDAFLKVIHLFQKVGFVRSKPQFHTVQQNPKSSLDAGLRLDGIHALDLWDLIVLVLGNTTKNHDRKVKPVVCRDKNHVQAQSRRMFNVLNNVDLVPSNVQS